MITNLVATVTIALSTNVSERFPQHMVSDPPPLGSDGTVLAVYYGHLANVDNPQEKWVETNIVEVTTIQFDFRGRPLTATSQRPITNWTTHFDKRDDWVASQTNSPIPSFPSTLIHNTQ